MFRNKVNLQFTDCQNRVVVESKATSDYKEFDLGFQDALATVSYTHLDVYKRQVQYRFWI